MSAQQVFKAALRTAYQVRREQGLTVSRALHDAVDEVWADLLKPLAAIDPEDREQVERLIKSAWPNGHSARDVDAMQAALRELASPKPRIEEPKLVGAVVEDANGILWMRGDPASHLVWFESTSNYGNRHWGQIDAVKVLREGVSS